MGEVRSLQSYASTNVTPGRTKEQVEGLLERVGAKGYRWSSRVGYPGCDTLEAALDWHGRELAFRLEVAYEDERQRKQLMRALYWYLKTKVEAVQMGLVDLEHEFLPYLLTGSGRTVYEELGGSDMVLLPEGRKEE